MRVSISAAIFVCGVIAWNAAGFDRTAGVIFAQEKQNDFRHGDWPFQPPLRPPVPKVENFGWGLNPIDDFVLSRLEQAGLSPHSRADKSSLLRRLTFDLIGLPPTREELREFLADESPNAYAKVVDRLLSSPGYGERWAQHWLDVVRYAETEGFKSDRLRENAYKYRDYVIRSFNDDRPYDEFVRQQLAGDQLQPDNPQALIATGINRLYPDEDNAANLFQRRQEILNDVTETTGLAFMGLTMGCAQCHDHKFDDILQTDFYRLQAFFAPIVERDDIPAVLPAEIEQYQRRDAEWDRATAKIREEMQALLSAEKKKSNTYDLSKFSLEIQQCYLKSPAERTPLEEQIARMAEKQLSWRFDGSKAAKKLPKDKQARYRELEKRLKLFEHLKPEPLPSAMAISDVGDEPPPTYLLSGGNWKSPQQQVRPGFPEFIGGDVTAVSLTSSTQHVAGRRADLANWLTLKEHPLTARVIVNRLWQHHFGVGIVATPNDFGNMGESPTHPELLDWLAVELTEHNWSLKHIHRLLVTSTTYCQSSRIDLQNPNDARGLQVDGENRLLWHRNRRRLEAEAIRDAMLRVSGRLNRRMLGRSSRPALPEGVSPRYAWKPDENRNNHSRRSIYVLAKRNMRFPLFDVFDLPDMHASCASRTMSTNAPQALLMLNSRLTQELAADWADLLVAEFADNLGPLIEEAYCSAYGRSAEPDEIETARQFLIEHDSSIEKPDARGDKLTQRANETNSVSLEAVIDFCHALINSNEFLFIN